MTTPEDRALHIRFTGKVQGVYFRVQARDKARELGLTGWVRNLSTGDVEALARGTEGKVEEWANWCQDSMRLARVDNVTRMWVSSERFEEFEIRADG